LTAELLAIQGEDPGGYKGEFYCQKRPLDECGFYGDDDDLALVEALKAVDILYDPDVPMSRF